MKISKRIRTIGARIAAATAPYDVPADHAYSRQSIDAQREAYPAPIERHDEARHAVPSLNGMKEA
jgi:hypothetical protein